jgi:hypothetical protein
MAWVRIDDAFRHHPKVVEAGPLGIALHVCGLSYAAQYLTDGFLPQRVVPTLCDFRGVLFVGMDERDEITPESVADALVRVGLWEKEDYGYRIHDYLEYNPSRAQVMAERAAKVASGRAGGIATAVARATAEPQQSGSGRSSKTPAELQPVPVPVPVPVPDFTTRSPVPGPRATIGNLDLKERAVIAAHSVLADKLATDAEKELARQVLEDQAA